ncbi:unnamed protein product, partial [Sphacelaria rigidula]
KTSTRNPNHKKPVHGGVFLCVLVAWGVRRQRLCSECHKNMKAKQSKTIEHCLRLSQQQNQDRAMSCWRVEQGTHVGKRPHCRSAVLDKRRGVAKSLWSCNP